MSTTLENLKHLREVHKLSQTEISRRAKINQTRLSRWESGEVANAADAALRLKALRDLMDAEAALNPAVEVDIPTDQAA